MAILDHHVGRIGTVPILYVLEMDVRYVEYVSVRKVMLERIATFQNVMV